MTPRMPDPTDAFEMWLPQRVAHAVKAEEVLAKLLTDLQGAMAEARGRPPEERHTLTVRDFRRGSASSRTNSRTYY